LTGNVIGREGTLGIGINVWQKIVKLSFFIYTFLCENKSLFDENTKKNILFNKNYSCLSQKTEERIEEYFLMPKSVITDHMSWNLGFVLKF